MLVEDEKLKLVAHLGHNDKSLKLYEDVIIDDCLCGLAAKSGEIIISNNSITDNHHPICFAELDPSGHILIPIKAANKVVGVIYIYLISEFKLKELKISFLESLAILIGMAIDNARLYGEAKDLSLHDPLTGLSNRRLMDINLQQSITLAERYNNSMCVAMLDIDYFKQ